MIGVVARHADSAVVREFFELFKTPWEFYVAGRQYDVVLCTGQEAVPSADCGVVLVYDNAISEGGGRAPGVRRLLSWGDEIPIYCGLALFSESGDDLVDVESGRLAIHRQTDGRRQVVTVGYDLFAEIRALLTTGQPAEYAAHPTIDLHIVLMRKLIVEAGAELVEIRPNPKGHTMIACLTHDVDHPSIRLHGLDQTVLGFLHRATLGSLVSFLKGRLSQRGMLLNFGAALKLPLVQVGLLKDFWRNLAGYIPLEHGVSSTFFVIPFKGKAGVSRGGQHSVKRAARYGVADIAGQIEELRASNCEVGLHGIDAWTNTEAGKSEAEEIRRVTGLAPSGIRMHWLYFDENSALALEQAGFEYDSTVGYNETVGFRAGTAQVFRPLTVLRLLELPLHIMDTALFYPSYLNLPAREAAVVVGRLIDHASRLGGCLTVNWHDRSIAPERQWGGFYSWLLAEMKARGALLTNASGAVSWFRKRRSVSFEEVAWEGDGVRVALRGEAPASGLAFDVRAWRHGSEIERVEVQLESSEATGGDGRLTYVLVTPARNEADLIEQTIRSVVEQTVRPLRWVIVSDGSTDGTDEIVRRYAAEHEWIELVRMPERRDRHFGAKVQCFNAGFARIKDLPYDIVGNLDADITFDSGYFEFLLSKFAGDDRLGVAGTPFVEGNTSYDFRFTAIEHVSGACQLFRRQCFADIGGYTPVKGGGIDWIAVTTARMKGWKTRTFTEKRCFHHRPMGTASASKLTANFRLGQQDYYLGGHPVWQICRGGYQMARRPYIAGGLYLILGYFWAWLKGFERPVSPELVEFTRHEQMRRLAAFFTGSRRQVQ